MGLGDPRKRVLRVTLLLILDLSAVLVLTLLIVRGEIPLYPGGPIAYLILFAINVPLIWASVRQNKDASMKRGPVPLSLWIAAAVFTPAGIVAIAACVRSPSMPLGVQAGVAVVLVGYIWFMVYRLRRSQGVAHTSAPPK
jgi:hypothetical protein